MAYDAATGTIVLFGGGNDQGGVFGDTWTWDGTTWTQQAPTTSPAARTDAAMAYDAATGTMVLFGGCFGDNNEVFSDTWTWDGTTWTKQAPTTSPAARQAGGGMAYDAAIGDIVLFSGLGKSGWLRNTWTWGG